MQKIPVTKLVALDGAPREDARRGRLVPAPPVSGVRSVRKSTSSECLLSLRQLARTAESLSLEPLAFELFFAAARIESTGKVELVRGQLEEIATLVLELEARFYRRAVRVLARVDSAQTSPG